MPSSSSTGAGLFLLVSLLPTALASDSDHKYQADEQVTLWVNKVGPYNNPQEIYNYYSLPFCRPSQNDVHKWGGLGEVLVGNELIDSDIPITFLKNVDRNVICQLELDEAKVKHFIDAIESSYWFEFFMDSINTLIATVGFVGEIIHVNLTQDNPRPLEAGRTVDLTYSVQWISTNITFPRRFDAYLDNPFFKHQIHWFSIFNLFMMVIFLTGLVSMILMRTLINDRAKYAREDDDLESLEREVNRESGWKLVHGDVFRPPWSLVRLSAVVGTGEQLAFLVLLVILTAIVGTLYLGYVLHSGADLEF
ncbi:hypothetical protein Bca101_008741 [Brassica carinata]